MLFNSYIFIFVFLPVTVIGFYAIGYLGYKRFAVSWLVTASLFFYGWWNPAYLWLIIGSYNPRKVGCQKDEFSDFIHANASCLNKIFSIQ
jgi:hypothetical protein